MWHSCPVATIFKPNTKMPAPQNSLHTHIQLIFVLYCFAFGIVFLELLSSIVVGLCVVFNGVLCLCEIYASYKLFVSLNCANVS